MTDPWDEAPTIGKVKQESSDPWDTAPALKPSTGGVAPYAREFAGGFNEGLTKMAGAPVDITNWVLSKAGLGSDTPVGGSKSLQKAMSKGGDMFLDRQTEGNLGNVIRRTGEEVGAAILPAGAITKAATMPVKAGQQAGFIRKNILDPIQRAPGKASAGELSATAGAGVGAGTARNIAPESDVGETMGQLAGSVAPAALMYSTPGMVYKAGKSITSRFSKASQKRAAEKAVTEALGGEMTPAAEKSLSAAMSIKDKAAAQGVKWDPSIGEATGSPGLIKQQTELENRATGAFLEKVTKRHTDNLEAIQQYSQKVGPKSDLDAEYIIDTADGKLKTVGAQIDRLAGANVQKKRDLASDIPTIDRMASGKAIRDGIQKAKAEKSVEMSILANELGLSDVDLTDPFDAFKASLMDKYRPGSRFEDTEAFPKILARIVEDDAGTPTFFNDVKSIRERVSDSIIDEMGTAIPNRKKLRTLIMLKKDIDGFIDNQTGALGEQYKQFRQAYFEGYIKPFESGAVFKARNKNGTGFYQTNDEHVASIFLDNPSASKQYMEIFADDPGMVEGMKNAALDDLRRAATDDGILNPSKLKTWVRKRSEALEMMPEVKQAVDDVATAQNRLENRQIQLAGRKKEIENISLAKKITRYSKGDATADQVLNDAVQNPKKMRQLLSFVSGDEEAKNAMKRIVWENASNGTSADTVKFMAQNEKSLAVLFDKKQLRDMYDVSLMKAVSEAVKPPSGAALSDVELPAVLRAVENITGMKIPQFGTRLYALNSGRVAKEYIAMEAAISALRSTGRLQAEAIWKDALYDPDLARDLANAVIYKDFKKETAKKIGGRVFALGLPYVDKTQKEHPQ